MAKRQKEERLVSDVLKDFIKANRLEKGLDSVSIEKAWHKVMGTAISKYTTNIKLDEATLYVELSSSVLREELSYGNQKIIKLLNDSLDKEIVRKLVLR